jgi:RimJ/RimL family protein N-acetyltransferase
VIETERLLLRRPSEADLPGLIEVHAHPDVERFMGAWGELEAHSWLERVERCWDTHGYGRLVVLEKITGALLGRSGLQWFDELKEVELGWTLRREAWGRGYASEAARAGLAWAFEDFGHPYVTSRIEPANERSSNVAKRLGMEVIRTDLWGGSPFLVHALTQAAWVRQRARP